MQMQAKLTIPALQSVAISPFPDLPLRAARGGRC
jgi:hypothetical protein